MAGFTNANFITVFSGPPIQLHIYTSDDAIATVVASAYFSPIVEKLRKGDLIMVSTSNTGSIVADVLTVSSATGATPVTVTNGT
jgi:hypothetical protein